MLEQIGKHGGIDLTIKVKGDLEVDEHHTIEDTCLHSESTWCKYRCISVGSRELMKNPKSEIHLPIRRNRVDRKSTRLNSSHSRASRMPSSA